MTTTLSLEKLIKKGKFDYVNSDITPSNFPAQPLRSSEYKLFHFNRSITSEDAEKEIEKEGYTTANIFELLSWKDWNSKDIVIALGSSCMLGGDRRVPRLRGFGERYLYLYWWDGEWDDGCRFLAVRNSGSTSLPEHTSVDITATVRLQVTIIHLMEIVKSGMRVSLTDEDKELLRTLIKE